MSALLRRLWAERDTTPVPVLLLACCLVFAVGVIHLQDQGGLPGSESPLWIKYGYYLVEVSSVVTAGLLLRGRSLGWLLGVGSCLGPFAFYILSRTTGIPGDSGDVGNWGYVLGTVSLVAEAAFVLTAAVAWRLRADPARRPVPAGRSRAGSVA